MSCISVVSKSPPYFRRWNIKRRKSSSNTCYEVASLVNVGSFSSRAIYRGKYITHLPEATRYAAVRSRAMAVEAEVSSGSSHTENDNALHFGSPLGREVWYGSLCLPSPAAVNQSVAMRVLHQRFLYACTSRALSISPIGRTQ